MTLPVLGSHQSNELRPSDDGGRPLDPLRELSQLQQRMSQLTASLLGTDPLAGTSGLGAWTPLADVTETDDGYLVEIEVPGTDRRTLDVEVAGAQLRVSGEIVEKEKAGWLRHRTRRVGRFAYSTSLPGDVDPDHITADLADGVLNVRVPKTEAAKPRRITVNAT